jgi:hypothetical protein
MLLRDLSSRGSHYRLDLRCTTPWGAFEEPVASARPRSQNRGVLSQLASALGGAVAGFASKALVDRLRRRADEQAPGPFDIAYSEWAGVLREAWEATDQLSRLRQNRDLDSADGRSDETAEELARIALLALEEARLRLERIEHRHVFLWRVRDFQATIGLKPRTPADAAAAEQALAEFLELVRRRNEG